MRRFACVLASLALGCGGARRTPAPPPTLDEQILSSADAVLECLGTAGSSCLYTTVGNAAWIAQQDLELVAALPPPVLAGPLLDAADGTVGPNEGVHRAVAETARAAAYTEDMSCRAVKVEDIGRDFDARRTTLVKYAERLGLGTTVVGSAVAALRDAALPLGRAKLVTAQCNRGDLYLLISPPNRARDQDEDPRAHSSGGWEPFVVSTSRERLVRGVPLPARGPAPLVADPAPDRAAVDPWIPVSEVDL